MLFSKLEKPLGSTEESQRESLCLLVNARLESPSPKDWFTISTPMVFCIPGRPTDTKKKGHILSAFDLK